LIPLLFLAAALPGLYWEQGPETATTLKSAGIECIHVAPANVEAWKAAGYCAATADPAAYEKLPQPGVEYRPDVARATSAPWLISNGARLLRVKSKPVYYVAAKDRAALCAAEAFTYGAQALIHADAGDLNGLGAMLQFLKRMDAPPLPARSNIGFIDDGSPEAAEVMNLLIRRNLLFRVVTAPDPRIDLNVQLGSPGFPRSAAANPSDFARLVRQKLTDEKRLLRIYGSEVVVGRLTGDGSHARLHLLNYSGRKVEGLRVRVLGAYKNAQLFAPGTAPAISDFLVANDATEFSLPALETYAIIDLR
jgi:hypothetical protein